MPAWQFPTNLIHGPLTSFAAVRGIAPWLAAWPAWQKLQLASAPDQACCWSQSGIPFKTYLAAPLPGRGRELEFLPRGPGGQPGGDAAHGGETWSTAQWMRLVGNCQAGNGVSNSQARSIVARVSRLLASAGGLVGQMDTVEG